MPPSGRPLHHPCSCSEKCSSANHVLSSWFNFRGPYVWCCPRQFFGAQAGDDGLDASVRARGGGTAVGPEGAYGPALVAQTRPHASLDESTTSRPGGLTPTGRA